MKTFATKAVHVGTRLMVAPLLLLIMLMTNNRRIMGTKRNTQGMNVLGWTTTAAIFLASAGLIATWFI